MKILAISAGTRNGRNDSMCKEALKAAKNFGADIEFIRLLDLDIKHCTGCTACVQSILSGRGNMCVLKDDFDWFLDKFYDADGVFFSVPIFEKGAAGIFRTLMDRFGPRMARVHNIIADKLAKEEKGKEVDPRFLKEKVISYLGLGGSEWTTNIQSEFAVHALSVSAKLIHNEIFPWSTGLMMDDERIQNVYNMGKDLAEAAANIEAAEYRSSKGVCPNCYGKNFYISDKDSSKAVCCQCGIQGEIVIEDNKMSFEFEEEQLKHAHTCLEGQIIHAEDIKRNLISLFDDMKTDKYKNRMKEYSEFITPLKPEK